MSEKGQGELLLIILFFLFICIASEFLLEGGGLLSYLGELFFESDTNTPDSSNEVQTNDYYLPCTMRVDYTINAIEVLDSEDLGGDEPYIFYELFYVDGGNVLRAYSSAIWASSEELESGTVLGSGYDGWPHRVDLSGDLNDVMDFIDGAYGGSPSMLSVDIPAPFSGYVGVYVQVMESDMDKAAAFAGKTLDIMEDLELDGVVGHYLPGECSVNGKNLCIMASKVWAEYKGTFDTDEFLGENGYTLSTAELDGLIGSGQVGIDTHNFSGWDLLTPYEYNIQAILTPQYINFSCK